MSALQPESAEKCLFALLHHLSLSYRRCVYITFEFRVVGEHIQVRLKGRLSSAEQIALLADNGRCFVKACKSNIGVKAARFMGQ